MKPPSSILGMKPEPTLGEGQAAEGEQRHDSTSTSNGCRKPRCQRALVAGHHAAG